MTKTVVVRLGVWNAGRTKRKTVKESADLFTKNFNLVHTKLKDGFGLFQEWDEADKADEHGISAKIAGETHKWLRFPSAVPVMIPDEWKLLRRPLPATIKMSDGIARWSPHRVLTKGLVALRSDLGCRFLIGSTHIMRSKPGEADRQRRKHIKRLKNQFHYAAKRDLALVIGMDANDVELEKLHPNAKVLYHRGLDYIIALDSSTVKFKHVRKQTVDTTIDGHDLGIVDVEIEYEELAG